jgi:hypothetical protein
LVPRPGLFELLGAAERVVQVSAPAGSGKTFLVRSWIDAEVSLDGADGADLPIAIEEVGNVSRRLRSQAAQLAGGKGAALLLDCTTLWEGPDSGASPSSGSRARPRRHRLSVGTATSAAVLGRRQGRRSRA